MRITIRGLGCFLVFGFGCLLFVLFFKLSVPSTQLKKETDRNTHVLFEWHLNYLQSWHHSHSTEACLRHLFPLYFKKIKSKGWSFILFEMPDSVQFSVTYFLPWIPALSCTSFREQTYVCFISSPLSTFAGSQCSHCLCWDLFGQSRLGFPWFSPLLRCRLQAAPRTFQPNEFSWTEEFNWFFWNSQTLPLWNIHISPKDWFSLFSLYERMLLVCPESHPNRPERAQPGMKMLQPGSFFSNT